MTRFRWRKSSFSGYHECVELAHTLNAIRDTKNPTGPVLVADVKNLLTAIKRGELHR